MDWQAMSYQELIAAAGVERPTASTYLYVDTDGQITSMEKGGAWDVPCDEFESIGYAFQLRGVGRSISDG